MFITKFNSQVWIFQFILLFCFNFVENLTKTLHGTKWQYLPSIENTIKTRFIISNTIQVQRISRTFLGSSLESWGSKFDLDPVVVRCSFLSCWSNVKYE